MREDLTAQEQKILDMLLSGSKPKEIAAAMHIGSETVRTHQKKLYRKIGVHNIGGLFEEFHGEAAAEIQWKDAEIAVFTQWYPFNDDNSPRTIAAGTNEIINGRRQNCITITGKQSDAAGYTGIFAMPDDATVQALRTMRSFSFKVMGDGSRYSARLPTFETISGDHFLYYFHTIKDQIMSIKVNVPGGLVQHGWSGIKAEFIQDNIMFFQFQTVDPGPFCLKFWDIRLHR